MKHIFKLFSIAALVAVIGFSMIACDGDDGNGGDTTPNDDKPFNAADGAANIGRTGPAGGKIFYYSAAGFIVQMLDPAQNYTANFLEAAPSDQVTGLTQSTNLAWGETGVTISTATTIGTGRKNTAIIHADPSLTLAASSCYNKTQGGFSDWFLPSKDELNELYKLYISKGQGTYANLTYLGNYWSSSTSGDPNYPDNVYAWKQFFGDSSQPQSTEFRSTAYRVRAIRAF